MQVILCKLWNLPFVKYPFTKAWMSCRRSPSVYSLRWSSVLPLRLIYVEAGSWFVCWNHIDGVGAVWWGCVSMMCQSILVLLSIWLALMTPVVDVVVGSLQMWCTLSMQIHCLIGRNQAVGLFHGSLVSGNRVSSIPRNPAWAVYPSRPRCGRWWLLGGVRNCVLWL